MKVWFVVTKPNFSLNLFREVAIGTPVYGSRRLQNDNFGHLAKSCSVFNFLSQRKVSKNGLYAKRGPIKGVVETAFYLSNGALSVSEDCDKFQFRLAQ